MPRTAVILAVLLPVAAVATGCVPVWVYKRALEDNENFRQINDGIKVRYINMERRALDAEHAAAMAGVSLRQYEELTEDAKERLKKASEEIQKLLREHVEKDLGPEAAGGEVRITKDNKIVIAGDVLFPPGGAQLTKKAKEILKKLIPMLDEWFKKDAYIRIEGHTDDQPITRPATKRKFPTNWHLSSARAVSVLLELKKLGVPERKMYAAGYGEFTPRVPNKPDRDGHPGNRRVEIAIMESK